MKKSTWNCFLSLLLLVLLPLQGWAAASMLACAMQTAPSQMIAAEHAHHHSASETASADARHDQHPSPEHSQSEHHPEHSTQGKFKCGQGGACCPVAAIASQRISLSAPQANAVFANVFTTPPSAMVRKLERPPRHLLV